MQPYCHPRHLGSSGTCARLQTTKGLTWTLRFYWPIPGVGRTERLAVGRNRPVPAPRVARKQTPISRPESRIKNSTSQTNCVKSEQQRPPPSFLQYSNRVRFLTRWLRTESHQTPIRIKLAAMLSDRPGGLCHPRETLVPSRVQGVAYSPYGYRRDDDASPFVAHGLGDSAFCIHSDGAKAASKSVK